MQSLATRLNLLEKDVTLKKEKTLLKVNPEVYRPAEIELFIGNSVNAKDHLEWEA